MSQSDWPSQTDCNTHIIRCEWDGVPVTCYVQDPHTSTGTTYEATITARLHQALCFVHGTAMFQFWVVRGCVDEGNDAVFMKKVGREV
eukprot:366148-Chlamydomonas_euryale.AAC.6